MELVRTPSPPPPPSPLDSCDVMPVDLSERRQVNETQTKHHPVPQQQAQCQGQQSVMRQNQVGQVILAGVPIVSLCIDGVERLCLAQISSTLLSKFSYNEIHNRRVALGVTCVQCTPVQLEILRRAGAMPISSRRCGMITKREAERLVKSFLEETTPPKLPENFAFKVKHQCGWGCSGSFVPARYNSSRAKCIKCAHCNVFFSPNKFIFHFHRTPDSKYQHPDAANFNSWRRHIFLEGDNVSDELSHAWEDVKAMFNGGSRKRLMSSSSSSSSSKQSRVDLQLNKRPRLSDDPCGTVGKMPPVNFSYPVFPQNNSLSSLLPCTPPYRNFPFLPSHDNPALMEGVNPHKMNLAEMWRSNMSKNAPTPYYNPFGFLWAKNWGLYPPTDTSLYRVKGDNSLMSPKADSGKPMKATGRDDRSPKQAHHSAFKPVGLYSRSGQLGSPQHVESDVAGDVTPEDHMWGVNGSLQHQPLFSPDSSDHSPDSALESDQDADHVTDDDINVTDVVDDDVMPVGDSLVSDSADSEKQQMGQGSAPVTEVTPEVTLEVMSRDTPIPKLEQPPTGELQDENTTNNTPTREDCNDHKESALPSVEISSIYAMSREQLQSELLRIMARRTDTEAGTFTKISTPGSADDDSSRVADYQKSVQLQLQSMKDQPGGDSNAHRDIQQHMNETHTSLDQLASQARTSQTVLTGNHLA